MRWTGPCLMLATAASLALARYEESYNFSYEDDSLFHFEDAISRGQLKSRVSNQDLEFIRRICSPEDPTRLYELSNQVGQGKYGKVYKGRRRSDGKQVAVKTICMDQHPEMLMRELRALNIVTHSPGKPRTLPVMYAAYKDVTDAKAGIVPSDDPHKKRLWIIMEFVEGTNMLTMIRNDGSFELSQIRTVMRQVMDTLCYIHNEHKLIHGDLIPQNIILNNRNELAIKFIDFGLSRMFEEASDGKVAWELTKAGAMAYRMRFGDMPTHREHGREERMSLEQLCASKHLTSKVPKDLLSFMNACVERGAEACQLKDHHFLRGSRKGPKAVQPSPFLSDDDDHYEVEAAWYNRVAERDLYR